MVNKEENVVNLRSRVTWEELDRGYKCFKCSTHVWNSTNEQSIADPVPDMQPVCKMQEEGSYPLHCPQATLTWRAILPSLTFSTAISTLTSHLCLVQLNNSCTSFGWPSSSLTTPVLTQFNTFKIFISDTQTKKQVYMPRSYHKLKNNMNGQAACLLSNSPVL